MPFILRQVFQLTRPIVYIYSMFFYSFFTSVFGCLKQSFSSILSDNSPKHQVDTMPMFEQECPETTESVVDKPDGESHP